MKFSKISNESNKIEFNDVMYNHLYIFNKVERT